MNKKIGILTFPNSPSFGASLQMYALYKTVESMGFDVEIINYVNSYMWQKKHISNQKVNILKKGITNISNLSNKYRFKKFEKQLVFFPKKTIHNAKDLAKLNARYDYMICGSDQVWNPNITGGDISYFFDFCDDNKKKISYAPSFGLSSLPHNCESAYKDLISSFNNRLSIREESGAKIIKELTGRDAKIVLDPSMLLKKEDWLKQIKKKYFLPKRYIAYFIFNKDESVSSFAKKLSIAKGLPIIYVGGNSLTKLKHPNYSGSLGPKEWLYVINNADYVITDSFHGAAFSIILEKELYVSLASSTNSRLVTLLETFNLKNRIINKNCETYVNELINYDDVRKIMEQKRIDSLEYLKQSLEDNYE